jgi:hypothetical protein
MRQRIPFGLPALSPPTIFANKMLVIWDPHDPTLDQIACPKALSPTDS